MKCILTGHATARTLKKHEPDFYGLDDEVYSGLMLAVKKLSKRVNDTFHPKKVGLILAGWDVPHTHVHVIPMRDYHDITSKSLMEGKRSNPTQEELGKVASQLRD